MGNDMTQTNSVISHISINQFIFINRMLSIQLRNLVIVLILSVGSKNPIFGMWQFYCR